MNSTFDTKSEPAPTPVLSEACSVIIRSVVNVIKIASAKSQWHSDIKSTLAELQASIFIQYASNLRELAFYNIGPWLSWSREGLCNLTWALIMWQLFRLELSLGSILRAFSCRNSSWSVSNDWNWKWNRQRLFSKDNEALKQKDSLAAKKN